MGVRRLLFLVLIISLALFAVVYAVMMWLNNRSRRNRLELLSDPTRPKDELMLRKRWQQFLQTAYIVGCSVPLLSAYIRKVRKRVSGVHAYEEFYLRHEVMNVTLSILGTLGISVAVLFLLNPSLSFLLLVLLTAVVINSLLIDMVVNRLERRLLVQMLDLFSDIRHRYHQHGMVDEALQEADESADDEAGLHTRKIAEALISNNPSEELEKYYEAAPNRFLKAFAGISYMIMEFGDKVKEQGSIYLQGLSGLTKEIHLEILRRSKLDYLLKGLNVIALVPLFFTKPIERWARSSFPAMDEFYMSKLGYAAKILIYIEIILSFVLLQKLQQNDETTYRAGRNSRPWEKAISRFPLFRVMATWAAPHPGSADYSKVVRLMKETGTELTYEWFYIRRVVYSLIVFAVTLTMTLYLHQMSRHHIMYDPVVQDSFFGQTTITQQEEGKRLSSRDLDVMRRVNMSPEATYAEIAEQLQADSKGFGKDELVDSANRILGKLQAYHNEYFKWWELVLCLFAGMLGYEWPFWLLLFQRKLRYMDMRHEVYQYQTVISMLREMDRISVEEILEWMDRFAVIFKIPIQKCLIHYDHGGEMALQQLKEEVRFTEFQRIVDKLLLSVEKIPISQAFDDLEGEMSFYFEQRKQDYERIIDTKAGLGRLIGFAPMYSLIFIYLVIPLIAMSFMQMNIYYEQIQKI
ncbi:hypothetical protein [Paenibacillus cineris]|uniref:Type II secretion system protein GspF domain-containing protein n=1 Tax=Paenibacillus cineris TaxID=237530 RepID=A0ABQ4LEQ0_9BACL|nr:hypothetical protein [Paenibacillus cineris]GIO55029.1 hypothetical protein J21TS7_33470 [Paenibacillus cineris]